MKPTRSHTSSRFPCEAHALPHPHPSSHAYPHLAHPTAPHSHPHIAGANSLRCAEGCAFSVAPVADTLVGLNSSALQPSLSETAITPTLAEAEEGVVRLELKLAEGFDDEDLLIIKQVGGSMRARHLRRMWGMNEESA